MEEINLKELLDYYLDKIVYVMLITFLIFLIGFCYSFYIEKPKYQSSTTLILTGFSSDSESGSIINTNDLNINQKLLATYRQIATSRKVLNQVIEQLNLDYTVNELATKINVSSVEGTEIIKITVTDEKALKAYKITSHIASVFSKEVKELYKVSNVSILDEAEIPEIPYNDNKVKSIIIYIAIGLILSSTLVFMAFYFDTTIKNVEQIESKFDVPILGIVPVYNNKKKRKGKK